MPKLSKKPLAKAAVLLDVEVTNNGRSVLVKVRDSDKVIFNTSSMSQMTGCCSLKVLHSWAINEKATVEELRTALLSKRVIDAFKVGYDPTVHACIFTVVDAHQSGEKMVEAIKPLKRWKHYETFQSRHGEYNVHLFGMTW